MTDALRQRSSESGMPPERLEHFRGELFAVREEILGLMQRFREEEL